MKISTLAAGVALSALMVTGAVAADLGGKSLKDDSNYAPRGELVNWTGLYVGGQCGFGTTTVGTEDDKGGLSADGGVCGARAGVDFALGSFLIGGYAEYNWSGEALEFAGTSIVEQDNDWFVMGRAGYIMNGRTLAYIAGGIGQVDYSLGSAVGGGSETFEATKAAIGLEHMFAASGWSIGLEASRAWIDVGHGLDDFIDAKDDRVVTRLTYKIGRDRIGY